MSFSPTDDDEPLSDINVTPFVDVLLVLLIIFMITAPIIHHTVKVDLPKDTYSDGAALDKTLRVVVDQTGMIYINNDQVGLDLNGTNREKFERLIQEWLANKSGPQFVDVEADENVRYGALVPIIARLKEMEVGLNLVINPESAQ